MCRDQREGERKSAGAGGVEVLGVFNTVRACDQSPEQFNGQVCALYLWGNRAPVIKVMKATLVIQHTGTHYSPSIDESRAPQPAPSATDNHQ